MKVETISDTSIRVTADNGDVFDIIDNGEGIELSSFNGKDLILKPFDDSILEVWILP